MNLIYYLTTFILIAIAMVVGGGFLALGSVVLFKIVTLLLGYPLFTLAYWLAVSALGITVSYSVVMTLLIRAKLAPVPDRVTQAVKTRDNV